MELSGFGVQLSSFRVKFNGILCRIYSQNSPVPLFPSLRVPPCSPHFLPCRLGSTVGTMSTTTMCQGHAHPQCRASVTAATWGSRGAGLSVLTTLRPLRDPLRPLAPCQRPLRPPRAPWHPTRPPQHPPTSPGPQRSRCISAGHEQVTPGTFGLGGVA